eukprot:1187807-Amphidinium_carterae.1
MELWHCSGKIVPDADVPEHLLELWQGSDCSERVDDGTRVRRFPGLKRQGEISEYQLVLTR